MAHKTNIIYRKKHDMMISQNFSLDMPFEDCDSLAPQELYSNFERLRGEIQEIIDSNPNYTNWHIEFNAYNEDNEDYYGSSSIRTKLFLTCQRLATEKEIAAQEKIKAQQEARDRQTYENLKKRFEK